MKQTKRFIFLLLSGLFLLGLVCIASIACGSKYIPFNTVINILIKNDTSSFEGAVIAARMPRTFFGLFAGAALGISGVMMQSITRNPIADPSILGVNTGASLMIVLGLTLFGSMSGQTTIILSFLGASITAAIVYGIASTGHGNTSPMKLALAGAAVSTALNSMVSTLMLPDTNVMKAFRFWQVGSLSGTTWQDIRLVCPYLVVGFVLAIYISPALNALSLGDEMATGLGINVGKTRLISAVAGVLLCASVTALAGPIGFIGLMVPHLIRMISGANIVQMIPLSAIYGSVLLVLSDIIGRIAGRPGELEVGIVTALLGAPIFIIVVRKARLQSL